MMVLGDDLFWTQHCNGLGAHVAGNVAWFQVTQQRMDHDAVTGLDGDLGQILVRAMHGVTRLKARHLVPTHLFENGACLLRGLERYRRIWWGNH